jgi:hypothetical protein
MLIIATGYLVGPVKSVRTKDNVSDWVSAVSLIVEAHGCKTEWITQIHLVSNDFLVKTMHAPEYEADPFYLVPDVSQFAEMDI